MTRKGLQFGPQVSDEGERRIGGLVLAHLADLFVDYRNSIIQIQDTGGKDSFIIHSKASRRESPSLRASR